MASPAIRFLAKEKGIDINQVAGSGPKGRVLKADILDYKGGKSTAPPSPSPSTPISSTPASSTSTPILPSPVTPIYTREDQVFPIKGLQRIMVQTMIKANSVPCFGYGDEIMIDNLIQLREECKPIAEENGIKLSYMPFIIKATSLALTEYPKVNAHVNEDCTEHILKGSHNIGVAMDTPRGLLVPNVKNVQDKTIFEIANDLSRLQQLGLDGKLGTADLTGGTFTLSNIGSIGGTYCSPILFLPEVCIGALGKFQTLPRFDKNQKVKPTTVMTVSWTADHRILDGATVAHFSNKWKMYLENPLTMILGLK